MGLQFTGYKDVSSFSSKNETLTAMRPLLRQPILSAMWMHSMFNCTHGPSLP